MLLPKLKLRLLSEQDSLCPGPSGHRQRGKDRPRCGERAAVMDPLDREVTWSHLNIYKHTSVGMGVSVQTFKGHRRCTIRFIEWIKDILFVNMTLFPECPCELGRIGAMISSF